MARARGTTIAAIASPAGGAARAVVRISGPRTAAIVAAACARVDGGGPWAPGPRGATQVVLDDGVADVPARVLWFPAPRSFTREDVAELHVPGAVPLVQRTLQRVLGLGATLAEPGEFTRRAFEHGRIDLSRAEGVLALVEARTRGERRAATALLLGGLEGRLAAVRDALEEARALIEASLDFDESDTGHVPKSELDAALEVARARLAETLAFEERRELARGEARVVLVGEPNAGKSALFNALASLAPLAAGPARTARAAPAPVEERALVADVRGTTRDPKAVTLHVARRTLTLVDTAGLELDAAEVSHPGADAHAAGGELARRAEERTLAARSGADLLLWVVDARRPERAGAAFARRALGDSGVPVVLAWNQCDRPDASPAPAVDRARGALADPATLAAVRATSAATGEGCAALATAVAEALAAPGAGAPAALALAARTRERLAAAERELDLGRAAWSADAPADLVAQHLRDATEALDALAGRTTPEDLLDRIFARFCLGK